MDIGGKKFWGFSLPLPHFVEEASNPTKKMHVYQYIQKCVENLEGLHLFQYFVMFIRQFFRAELVNKSLVLKFMVKF